MNYKVGDIVIFADKKKGQQVFNECGCNDTFLNDFRIMSGKVVTITSITRGGNVTVDSKKLGVSRNWNLAKHHVELGIISKHNPIVLDEGLFTI